MQKGLVQAADNLAKMAEEYYKQKKFSKKR
jgi:hypothetical protein